jgi:hypothetical protein
MARVSKVLDLIFGFKEILVAWVERGILEGLSSKEVLSSRVSAVQRSCSISAVDSAIARASLVMLGFYASCSCLCFVLRSEMLSERKRTWKEFFFIFFFKSEKCFHAD